jgi:hypothetical protein
MAALLLTFVLGYAKPEYECERWTWSGDAYNRKVVCLKWRKKK